MRVAAFAMTHDTRPFGAGMKQSVGKALPRERDSAGAACQICTVRERAAENECAMQCGQRVARRMPQDDGSARVWHGEAWRGEPHRSNMSKRQC